SGTIPLLEDDDQHTPLPLQPATARSELPSLRTIFSTKSLHNFLLDLLEYALDPVPTATSNTTTSNASTSTTTTDEGYRLTHAHHHKHTCKCSCHNQTKRNLLSAFLSKELQSYTNLDLTHQSKQHTQEQP